MARLTIVIDLADTDPEEAIDPTLVDPQDAASWALDSRYMGDIGHPVTLVSAEWTEPT